MFEFINGKPVDEAIHEVSEGVKIEHLQDNVYSLSVSPLVKKENGKMIQVSEKEYEHQPWFLPKKCCYCCIGSDKYSFTFRVAIPKRSFGGGGGKSSQVGQDKKTNNETLDVYQELASGLWGMYSNSRLLLNKKQPLIRDIASFNREKHPSLYKRWKEAYAKASKIAIGAHAHASHAEIDYAKKVRMEFDEQFGAPESWFINTHLDVFFRSDEIQNLLADVRKTKIQTEAVCEDSEDLFDEKIVDKSELVGMINK